MPNSAPYIHDTAVVEEGALIGNGSRVWHFCHLMAGCVIGENCSLGQNVVVMPRVLLGNNVKVQNNVSLYEGVVCENDVFLGPSAVFTNVRWPRSAYPRRETYAPTVVRQGATVGANATIVCGIEIGAYAFVGAGAVVTRSVPAYALVFGNPAKQVGWASEAGGRLTFNHRSLARCPETGETYLLTPNGPKKME